jgi:hypothetical protein
MKTYVRISEERFGQKFRGNQNFQNIFFQKSWRLWDNVGKMEETDWPQMTVQYIARFLHAA